MVMGQKCCFLSVAAGRISAIAVPLLLLVCCLGLRVGAQGIYTYTAVSVVRVYTDWRALCSSVWGRISESERPARVTG